MNRMSASVSRVPPPPDAPREAHERYVEAVRREIEEEREEARARRLSVAARAGVDVLAEERLRELEELVALAASADERTWPRVREAARALLARRAG